MGFNLLTQSYKQDLMRKKYPICTRALWTGTKKEEEKNNLNLSEHLGLSLCGDSRVGALEGCSTTAPHGVERPASRQQGRRDFTREIGNPQNKNGKMANSTDRDEYPERAQMRESTPGAERRGCW